MMMRRLGLNSCERYSCDDDKKSQSPAWERFSCWFLCFQLFVRNENSSQIRKFEEEEEVKEVKFNQQGRNGTQTDFNEWYWWWWW